MDNLNLSIVLRGSVSVSEQSYSIETMGFGFGCKSSKASSAVSMPSVVDIFSIILVRLRRIPNKFLSIILYCNCSGSSSASSISLDIIDTESSSWPESSVFLAINNI